MDRAGEAEAAEGGAPGTLRPAARANYREYIDRINAEQRVIVQAAVDVDPNMAYWVYQPLPHYEEAVPPSEVVTKTEKGDGKPDPASKNHDAAVKR